MNHPMEDQITTVPDCPSYPERRSEFLLCGHVCHTNLNFYKPSIVAETRTVPMFKIPVRLLILSLPYFSRKN